MSAPIGPVDGYLDELFDGLAGTGAAGRRALAEAEDHLRAIEEEGLAAGLPPEDAGRVAVRRFGPVGAATRELRGTRRRRRVLAALSGAWLVAGIAVVGLGVAFLATAVSLAVQRFPSQGGITFYLVSASANVQVYVSGGSPPQDAVFPGVLALLAGLAILGARAVLRRRARLPRTTRQFPAYAAGLFVIAGAVFVAWPPTDRFLTLMQGPGLRISSICACVALAAALGLTVWGAVRSRRAAVVPSGGGDGPVAFGGDGQVAFSGDGQVAG